MKWIIDGGGVLGAGRAVVKGNTEEERTLTYGATRCHFCPLLFFPLPIF